MRSLRALTVSFIALAVGCGGAAAERREPEPAPLAYQPVPTSSGPTPRVASLSALLSPLGERLPPERLAEIVRFIREFERDPYAEVPGNDTGMSVQGALVAWIIKYPGLSVVMCPFLRVLDGESGDEVGPRTTIGAILGMAAYLLEHPGADPTSAEVQVAGVESGLRWYEASVRRGEPRIEFLDELRARRDRNGGLQAWYDEHQIRCGEQPAAPPPEAI